MRKLSGHLNARAYAAQAGRNGQPNIGSACNEQKPAATMQAQRTLVHMGMPEMSTSMGDVSCSGPFFTCHGRAGGQGKP